MTVPDNWFIDPDWDEIPDDLLPTPQQDEDTRVLWDEYGRPVGLREGDGR